MEEFIGYIIVGLGYLIWAGIRAASKKQNQGNKAIQKPEKDQANSLAASSGKNDRKKLSVNDLIEQFTQLSSDKPKARQKSTPKEKHWLDMDEKEKAFLTREVESARQSHYSEVSLVEEYKRNRAQGRPIPHHTHSPSSFVTPDTRMVDEEYDYDKKREHHPKRHAYIQQLRKRKNIRNAFILKELLDRRI